MTERRSLVDEAQVLTKDEYVDHTPETEMIEEGEAVVLPEIEEVVVIIEGEVVK